MYDILTTDEFSFKAEVDKYKHVLLHVDVYKPTHNTIKTLRTVFSDALEALHYEGFMYAYTITPSSRFVYMVTTGGVSLGQFEGREVIEWQLD